MIPATTQAKQPAKPPAKTLPHVDPPHSCAGCRNLARLHADAATSKPYWCLQHVTPLARCRLYEHPPTGNPSHLSSLMTR